jgi:opacity protein-like surface antigen
MRCFPINVFAVAATALPLSTTVLAGSDSGFYLGGSLGQATIKAKNQTPGGEDFDFNEDDSGYKIFAGYNFGLVPLVDLAVEGAYVDFGNPNTALASDARIEYDLAGWDIFGLAALTFGPFSAFGKAGVIAWDSDVLIDDVKSSNSGSDPAYGLGVKLQFGSLAARAEIEYFDINEVNDAYLASIGLSYTL